jgi:hypothetical protein
MPEALLAITVRATAIMMTMVATSTCGTSVKFYQTTWSNNPEDSHLHIRSRKNLKSHLVAVVGIVLSFSSST